MEEAIFKREPRREFIEPAASGMVRESREACANEIELAELPAQQVPAAARPPPKRLTRKAS